MQVVTAQGVSEWPGNNPDDHIFSVYRAKFVVCELISALNLSSFEMTRVYTGNADFNEYRHKRK
jgi:hypothetical protein